MPLHGQAAAAASGACQIDQQAANSRQEENGGGTDDNPNHDNRKSAEHGDSGGRKSVMDLLTTELTLSYRKEDGKKEFIHAAWFKRPIFLCIFLDTLTMGLSAEPDGKHASAWMMLSNFFTTVFFGEMICKLYVLRRDYWREKWNCVDAFLAIFGVVDYWIIVPAGYESSVIKMMRTLVIVRLLRLMREFRQLWFMFTQILEAFKGMFWIAVLLSVLVYSFAIICVIGIGDGGKETYPGYDTENVNEWMEDIAEFNNYQYFGTMGRAMYTLFCIAILAEWPEIGRPVFEYQPSMIIVFMVFIVMTTFGVMNVFIGIIVESTMKAFQAIQRDHDALERAEKMKFLQNIKNALFSMDTDGDDSINFEELDAGLHAHEDLMRQINLPQSFGTQKLLDLLDSDADGEISSNEFVSSFWELIYNGPFQNHCVLLSTCNAILREIKLVRNRAAAPAAAPDMVAHQQVLDERLDEIVLAYRNLATTVEAMANRPEVTQSPVSVKERIGSNGIGSNQGEFFDDLIKLHGGPVTISVGPRQGNKCSASPGQDHTTETIQHNPTNDSAVGGVSLESEQPCPAAERESSRLEVEALVEKNLDLKESLKASIASQWESLKENEQLKGRLLERDNLVEEIMKVLSNAVFFEGSLGGGETGGAPEIYSTPPGGVDFDRSNFFRPGDLENDEPQDNKVDQRPNSHKPRQPGQHQKQKGARKDKYQSPRSDYHQAYDTNVHSNHSNVLSATSSPTESPKFLQERIAQISSSAAAKRKRDKELSKTNQDVETVSPYRQKVLNLVKGTLQTYPQTTKQWSKLQKYSELAGNKASPAKVSPGAAPEEFETEVLMNFLKSVIPATLKCAQEEGLIEDGEYVVSI